VSTTLGLTREKGYMISGQSLTLRERLFGFSNLHLMDRSNIEALARLRMMKNFDVSRVDIFIAFIANLEENEQNLLVSRSQPDIFAHEEGPMDKLRSFFLDTCSQILSAHFRAHWDQQKLPRAELRIEGVKIDLLADGTEKASSEVGFDAMNTVGHMWDGRSPELSSVGSGSASSKTSSMPQLADPWMSYLKKVLTLRIWRDDNGRLYQDLQHLVQERMDACADICHFKFAQLASRGEASDLLGLHSIPVEHAICRQDHDAVRAVRVDDESRREVRAILEQHLSSQQRSELLRNPVPGLNPYDDPRLAIILPPGYTDVTAHVERADATAPLRNVEASLEPTTHYAGSRRLLTHVNDVCMVRRHPRLNEEVFVTQLHVRAQAMNWEFQDKVKTILLSRTSPGQNSKLPFSCVFSDGSVSSVIFMSAEPKSWGRMREKLAEYEYTAEVTWPLVGSILDPVRCGIIVQNTSHILEVLSWFQDPDCGLKVVKIKNRYSAKADIIDGYRDLTVNVLYKGSANLSIIGEIQLHVEDFWRLKKMMHTLYKIKRAKNPDAV